MGLFSRPARLGAKLATRTTLLVRADPGDALLDAARRYDLQVRRVRDRLVFQNGVLLIGPVTMTPEIERRAGLPAGMAVAWYVGAGGLSASQRPQPRPSTVPMPNASTVSTSVTQRCS